MSPLIRLFIKILKPFINVKLYILKWLVLFFLLVLFIIWTVGSRGLFYHRHNEEPVIMWWTEGFPGTLDTKYCSEGFQCKVISDRNHTKKFIIGAYLFYGSNIKFDDMPLPRRPMETIWGLYHEESPRNVEELLHETVLNMFNFSSTFSRYSDVPFPLQYLRSLKDLTSTEYFIETTEKNALLKDLAPVLYLQSDCETSSERDEYVKSLMKYIKIDSYGACLNNKQLPNKFQEDYLNNLNEHEFLKFIAKYKFVIAIENGVCNDYITEKLWRAFVVGSIPIYFGSPTVRDWLPNNQSALLLQDFNTVEKMLKHVLKLLDDDRLYDNYLDHKIKKVITNKRLIEEFENRPWSTETLESINQFECLICKQLHKLRESSSKSHIVNKSHYDCPKPLSALTLSVNPVNSWVFSWEQAKLRADNIYKQIML